MFWLELLPETPCRLACLRSSASGRLSVANRKHRQRSNQDRTRLNGRKICPFRGSRFEVIIYLAPPSGARIAERHPYRMIGSAFLETRVLFRRKSGDQSLSSEASKNFILRHRTGGKLFFSSKNVNIRLRIKLCFQVSKIYLYHALSPSIDDA